MKRGFDWRALGLVLSISTLSGVGCNDTDSQEPTGGISDTLILIPQNKTVERGDAFQFGVSRVRNGASENVTARTAWSLSDLSIAEVSPSGLLTPTKPGTARITAEVDGLSTTTSVYVLGRPVDIQLSPGIVRLAKGTTAGLTATIISEDDTKREMSGDQVWASSDVKIASVSEGTVEGIAPGETTIVFSSRNRSFSKKIQVLDVALESIGPGASPSSPIVVGQRAALFADGLFTGGHDQDVSDYVQFKLVDEESEIVSLAGGVVTALKPGKAVINVVGQAGTVAEGKQAQLTVDVLEAPSSIELVGPTQISRQGEPFSVRVNGTVGTVTRSVTSLATISASPSGIVSISGTTISPLKAGEVKLTARVGTGDAVKQHSLTLNVVDAAPSSLAIGLPTGNTGTVAVGGTLALSGVAAFGSEFTQTVTRQVLWLSDNPTVAFVDNAGSASGMVTGLSSGTATIKGYYRGQWTDSKTITVTP